MKDCGFCNSFKKKLKSKNINFLNRDVDEFEEEYELFKELVGNSFVPAFLLMDEEKGDIKVFAPKRDFITLDEALNKILEAI